MATSISPGRRKPEDPKLERTTNVTTTTAVLPNPTSVSMIWITCYACGVAYGMARHVYDQRRKDKEAFFCTNGHSAVFSADLVEQQKRQIASLEQSLKFANDDRDDARRREDKAVRSERAQKANVTKLKRRAQHGVCAHCNRTFENVARHMLTKHPAEGKNT